MQSNYRKLAGAALVAVLALGANPCVAGDKRITVDTGDTFVIHWRDDWQVGTAPPKSPAGILVFHGADPKKWRVTVAPLPPNPTLTGDVGNLRIYVRNMARAMENGGLQVGQDQNSFDGATAHGFYVKAHDTNPQVHAQKTKDDPFTDGYTGAVNLDSKPYLFSVVWNPGSESDANAAFAALKTIRKL